MGRTEKGFVAFDDRCTNKGGSRAGGALICEALYVYKQQSLFNVNNGEVKAGPSKEKIRTYNIEEIKGKIFLNLEGSMNV